MRVAVIVALVATSQLAACSHGPSVDFDSGVAGGVGGGGTGIIDTDCDPIDGGVPNPFIYSGLQSDAGVPLAIYFQTFVFAYCDGWRRCAPFAPYVAADCVQQMRTNGSWTLASCSTANGTTQCTSVHSHWGELASAYVVAAQQGLLSYDEDQAVACLSFPWSICPAEDGVGPLEPAEMPPSCLTVYGPGIVDGGGCTFDLECPGGVCVSTDETCNGFCFPTDAGVTPVATGRGTFCGFDGGCDADAGLACDGIVCRFAAGTAQQPCEAMADCAPGLFCSLGGSVSGTCQPQASEGGACTHDANSALAPYGQECPGLDVCVGLAIAPDGGLLAGACQPAADFTSACTNLGFDDAGQRQLVSGCLNGYACSCGTCVMPPPQGTPCAAGPTPCNPIDSFCDAVSFTCQPKQALEATCMQDTQCQTGACSAGVCKPNASGECP